MAKVKLKFRYFLSLVAGFFGFDAVAQESTPQTDDSEKVESPEEAQGLSVGAIADAIAAAVIAGGVLMLVLKIVVNAV